jgi:hypothetical protein
VEISCERDNKISDSLIAGKLWSDDTTCGSTDLVRLMHSACRLCVCVFPYVRVFPSVHLCISEPFL